MRIFRITSKVKDPVLNRILDYLNNYFGNRIQAQDVSYSTNMDTDVAGEAGDIVLCSTDDTFYGCTDGGVVGSATWVALH